MSNLYVAAITGILYFVIKFIEQRFIKKEQPQMKVMFRDSLLVGLTCVLGHFIYDQFAVLVNEKTATPSVFVNEPDF